MNLKSLNCQYLKDADFVLLGQVNIQTSEQLVAHADLEALSRKSAVDLNKLKQTKKFILGNHCPLPQPATEILGKYLKRSFSIPFGCAGLDGLVPEGVRSHEISEICGLTASGKTQLCLGLVANMLRSQPAFKCLYVDSSKNFCAKRLATLLGADSLKLLDSVRVVECQNIFHLLTILSHITKCDPSRAANNTDKPGRSGDLWSAKLLIIDSLTCLFNQFRPYDQFDSGFYLNYLINYLRFLKSSFDMAVVITTNNNLIYSSSSSSSSSSNSHSVFNYEGWKSVPGLIVQLSKFPAGSGAVHLFEVIKCHRRDETEPDKNYRLFRITENGLADHTN